MLKSILRGSPYYLDPTSTSEEPFKVTTPIAEDEENNKVVFVETIFSVEDSFEELTLEIHFPIRVISLDGSDESFSTYDRNECFNFIPPECRNHIMPIVLAGCDHLIERLGKPKRLYFVTYMPLPPKALGKYFQLRDHLVSKGYRTITDGGTDRSGRTFWELAL